MYNLCDTCPSKGQVNCELSGVWREWTNMHHPITGDRVTKVGVFVDVDRNVSDPLYMPWDISADVLGQAAESCQNPVQTFFGKLLRRANMVYCPALHRLRLDSGEARRRALLLIKKCVVIDERTSMNAIDETRQFEPFSVQASELTSDPLSTEL